MLSLPVVSQLPTCPKRNVKLEELVLLECLKKNTLLFPASEATTVPIEFTSSKLYFVNTGLIAMPPLDGLDPPQTELNLLTPN